MNLHNQIMNLQCDTSELPVGYGHDMAYKLGHRDARHAAAELVTTIERQLEDLYKAAKNLRDIKGRFHTEQAMKQLIEIVNQIEKEM